MSQKDEVIINCLKELVDHNNEMIKFCVEGDHGENMVNYYEGKFDAYTRVLTMLRDFNRMEQI